jgi:hypothetical protein
MGSLVIKCFVVGPGGTFVTAERLKADPTMLGDRVIDLDAGPNGGLIFDDDNDMMLVEDTLPDAAWFFLENLPEKLRAGQGDTYPFRTGEASTTVTVDGETVTLTDYRDRSMQTTVAILLDALAKAKQGYGELLKLGGPKAA